MEWTRSHILGRGSSATVSAATSTSGDIFAVKSVELSQSESLKREQHFLSILKSPYVVSYKGCDITREGNNKMMMYNMFIEYMSCGSIIDLLSARNGDGLSNLEIASYTRQIVEGLNYIHSCGIVHCDIKGRNIMVDGNIAKIGDLGCAKWANEGSKFHGTPMFMAPEVARGQEQGFPADIWALGCTIIEMMTGDSPWANVNDPVSLLYKIAFSNEIPKIPNELCDQAKDFLSKCLVRDPRQRWTAKQLLNHPYIQQFDDISNQINCDKFVTSSPTSVLDQDIWDSMDASLASTEFSESTCSLKSVRQRMKHLAGKYEMKPKWECEKGENEWITIRLNEDVDRKTNSGGVFCTICGCDSNIMTCTCRISSLFFR
uniref:mitogen-activated protein kinase kinase kinase 18-like n=1 Tax=Erigeron canadensis TaxID=72917 RepID=UPI001CB8FEF0|nr:mitogen-activated protein kinase kinase kinase 18-like [Erigeron canadensis]